MLLVAWCTSRLLVQPNAHRALASMGAEVTCVLKSLLKSHTHLAGAATKIAPGWSESLWLEKSKIATVSSCGDPQCHSALKTSTVMQNWSCIAPSSKRG